MESNLVTLITCTGARPEAFRLCYQYMQSQTYKGPKQWIVVNDSLTPEQAEKARDKYKDFELYPGPTTWQEGVNTQQVNMLTALEHVRGEYVLVIEDDDVYHPRYIEMMVKFLQHVEIAGEANSKYYHLGLPGFQEMGNFRHASLCQTGIRSSLLKLLKRAVKSGQRYFDIYLWNAIHERRHPCVLFSNANLCIGMKGMPGRYGIGVGHEIKGYLPDPGLAKLKEWCGEYASNYSLFIRKDNGRRDADTKERGPSGLYAKVSAKSSAERQSTEARHDGGDSKSLINSSRTPTRP